MENIIAKLKRNRDNNIKINIALSFVFKIIGFGMSYMLVPLTINYLSDERYGIWLTLLSIISWVSFGDIGLGNGLRNKLTESLSNNDNKSGKEYISTAYAAMIVIVVLLFLIVFIVTPLLNWQEIFNTKSIKNKELIEVVIIAFGFFLCNFILSLYNQLYYAKQEASATGVGQLLINIIFIISILIIKKISYGNMIYLCICYGISLLLPSIILTFLFFNKNRELIPNIKFIKLNKLKDIFGLGIKFFIVQIACVVYFGTNNLIIAQVCGPKEVTSYNIVYKLFNVIVTGFTLLVTPLWSAYTEAYTKGDIKWIKKTIKKLNILLIPISICLIGMILSSKFLFKIWVGNKALDIQNSLIITMAISTFITVWTNIYSYFLNGVNEINIQMYISIITCIINIPLCIFFAKKMNMGSTGVMIGQILTAIPFSIIGPIQSYNLIKKSYYKEVIVK